MTENNEDAPKVKKIKNINDDEIMWRILKSVNKLSLSWYKMER
jgi:hypothetical protein